jgi:broad specificity phosphatase PhoE
VSTVFYLVRHAAHDQLGRSLTGRSPGVRLSEQGRRQAKALARRLSSEPLDGLHTSPQPRTRETAELIGRPREIVPEVSGELDEIDFGRWSGMAFAKLERDPDWRTWNEDRGSAQTPAGETMQGIARRVVSLIDQLRGSKPAGAFGLVSHCDVIKAGVCHYLGLPFAQLDRFEINPASVTTLVVGDWGGKVLRLNEVAAESPGGALA